MSTGQRILFFVTGMADRAYAVPVLVEHLVWGGQLSDKATQRILA